MLLVVPVPPVPAVPTTQAGWTAACRAAENGRRDVPFLTLSTLPGSRTRPDTPGRALERFGTIDDPGLQAPKGSPSGAVVVRRRGAQRLRLCDGEFRRYDDEPSTSVGRGPVVAVPRGERVWGAAVAWPWAAVVTRKGRSAGSRLRWFRMGRGDGARDIVELARVRRSVRLPGTFDAVTPAATGEVATVVRVGGRRRVDLHDPDGGRTRLVDGYRSSSTRAPLTAWLWGPRTIALSAPAGPSGLLGESDPVRVVELPYRARPTGCERPDGTRLRRTRTLSARVGTAPGMRGLAEEQHLRICTADGRLLRATGVGANVDIDEPGYVVRQLSVVGPVVFVGGYALGTRTGGIGYDAHLFDAATSRLAPLRLTGGGAYGSGVWFAPHAAAFNGPGGLWLSDALGARLVAATDERGPIETVILDDRTLRFVRGYGDRRSPEEQLPVVPLADDEIALEPPDFGR